MPKVINISVLISSLFGYLEWGGGNHALLFRAEYDILAHLFSGDTDGLWHPMILLPIAGQLILILTLFQKYPGRILTFTGITAIGVLLLLIFFIGIWSMNLKIIVSTFPFIICGLWALMWHRKAYVANIAT